MTAAPTRAAVAASLEAEQSVLGALLLDADTAWPAVESVGLRARDFIADATHPPIFGAVCGLRGRAEAVDIITTREQLQAMGADAALVPLAYLNALAQSVPSAHNARRYAQIVADLARRRDAQTTARALANAAGSAGLSQEQFSETLADARRELERIAEQRTQPPPFRTVPLADLAGVKIEAPAWVWRDLVPAEHVTVVSGHGGVGKSLFALMMAAAVAAGRPLFGVPTRRCRVAFYSGEDHAALLLHRLLWVCTELDIDPAELDGWLHVLDATEADPALFREAQISGQRVGATTAAHADLARYLERHDVGLLIVDNMSDTFDANEIERAKVRAFMRSLPQLRRERRLSVVLLAHVDKGTARGERSGTESYSGSTAVHNSARSRLALLREKDGALRLEQQKNNLGPLCPPLALVWPEGGLPQVEPPSSGYMQAIVRSAEVRALLRLIAEFSDRGEWVSPSINSATSAAKLLSGEPGYPRDKRPGEVQALLRSAERDHLLTREEFRSADRHSRERWAVTDAGLQLIRGGAGGAGGAR